MPLESTSSDIWHGADTSKTTYKFINLTHIKTVLFIQIKEKQVCYLNIIIKNMNVINFSNRFFVTKQLNVSVGKKSCCFQVEITIVNFHLLSQSLINKIPCTDPEKKLQPILNLNNILYKNENIRNNILINRVSPNSCAMILRK